MHYCLNLSLSLPKEAPNNYQLVIHPISTNKPLGDSIHPDNPPHNLQILSHNINTLSSANDFLDWKAATQAIMECNVNIACFQETSLQWSTPITKQIAQIICDQPTKQSKLAVSNSLKITPSNYQPGGTCTAAIGSWSFTVKSASQDPSNMGCWSYLKLKGKESHQIIIVLGYCSCSTYHDQQYQYCSNRATSHQTLKLNFLTTCYNKEKFGANNGKPCYSALMQMNQ